MILIRLTLTNKTEHDLVQVLQYIRGEEVIPATGKLKHYINSLMIKKEKTMRVELVRNMVVLMIAVIVLYACGGAQVKVQPIAVSENPGEQVGQLESSVGVALSNKINVLAPVSFEKVEKHLTAAKDGLNRGHEISGILENVARGRAYLERAIVYAEMARTALSPVIKAREDARAAGAPGFEREYADAEKLFLDLTGAIEEDNLNWAQKKQTEVVKVFRSLEMKAIKEKTLGEVRDTIDLAEKEGAKKHARDLYNDARWELDSVDAFISENPYQKEEMLKKANRALFNAQRLLELTRQSSKFQEMKPIETALWAEGMLDSITKDLEAPDMRNQSFETQLANILGTIGSMKPDRQFMRDKIKSQQDEIEGMRREYDAATEMLRTQYDNEVMSLNAKIADLEGKSKGEQAEMLRLDAEKRANEARLAEEKKVAEQRLAAERMFNELYNEVQSFFEAEEAEVYKQGDKLVIRLRSMKFPVGKSIIMPDNYSLLTKVQKAVRTFGEPEVVVEGHTDSTGSTAVNELLSQQRAESVREYLVANQTVPAEMISSVGYGSIRSLA